MHLASRLHLLRFLGIVALAIAFTGSALAQRAPQRDNGNPVGKRPFFIIGHHANTKAQVDDYVRQGANFIECDIHNYTRPFTFSGSDQIYVMHFLADEFTRKFTSSAGVDDYFANIKAKIDAGQICGIELDIKNTLVSDGPIHYFTSYPEPRAYGRAVANLLKRQRIAAERVIMGVDKSTRAGGDAGENWASEFMKGVRWDAQYNCLLDLYIDPAGQPPAWAASIASESDVGSLGKDQLARDALFEKFNKYSGWLDELTRLRDQRKQDLRFVYFWTVDSDVDLRNCLDHRVDGVITNKPAHLKKILNESKYQKIYRIADRNDVPIPARDRVKRSLADPFVYLKLRHQGSYVARFHVTWTEKGRAKSRDFGSRRPGWSTMLAIPRAAADVRVHALASVLLGSWRDIHNGPVDTGAASAPATYIVSGTAFNHRWAQQ